MGYLFCTCGQPALRLDSCLLEAHSSPTSGQGYAPHLEIEAQLEDSQVNDWGSGPAHYVWGPASCSSQDMEAYPTSMSDGEAYRPRQVNGIFQYACNILLTLYSSSTTWTVL
jgi:hypothetical protein